MNKNTHNVLNRMILAVVVLLYAHINAKEPNNTVKDENVKNFNANQISTLNNLLERKKYIEQEEISIQNKKKALIAIEKNVDNKIKRLEELQKKIHNEAKKHNIADQDKIKGFVKIYENMPPKQAANIFNAMHIDLLVQIISSMKEIKASNIITHMEVKRSTELSNILANKAFNSNIIQ